MRRRNRHGRNRRHDGEHADQGTAVHFPSIERASGRPIEAWRALLAGAGTTTHPELVGWLESEHGMGHGRANALVAAHLAERA